MADSGSTVSSAVYLMDSVVRGHYVYKETSLAKNCPAREKLAMHMIYIRCCSNERDNYEGVQLL